MTKKLSSSHQIALSIAVLSIMSGFLWSIDVQQNNIETSEWNMGSLITSLFEKTSINSSLLEQTSLSKAQLSSESNADFFFKDMLKLPEGNTTIQYSILEPNILISELSSNSPQLIIKHLIEQKKSSYSFNVINAGTFYLNQEPISEKTHNFLAITLEKKIFGFQYHPKDHHFVLEIIDALQKKQ
ncbi:MAG: hypothetical protein P1V18_06280 [Candidatus Gracilibacteria bacterium]|nr:hypothetical protein [Candidatus Gracilibacteria bacterium]